MRDRDYMVRGTAVEGRIRAFAIVTNQVVQNMYETHNTSPNVTAALGRLMTGALMMGAMMKNEKDRLTLSIRSEGPIQGMTVTVDNQGHVKGFPSVGVWSKPKTDAPYICLEPWIGRVDNMGFTGELPEKFEEQCAQPGESFKAVYTITVD